MWPLVRLAHLGVASAVLLSATRADSGLFQALRDAGASQFAQAIQADAEFLDLIAAGEVGTLFAPADSQDVAKLLFQRQTVASGATNLIQASNALHTTGNLKTNTGDVVKTQAKSSTPNGTEPRVVSNPSIGTLPLPVARQRDLNLRQAGGGQTSLVQISSGLGNIANVVKADIPFKRCGNSTGVIHIVDTPFTFPLSLSASAAALGLSTFNTLANGSSLDTTPSITVFIPTNGAFATANASQPSVRSLVVPNLLGYLPVLEDGARLVTQSGSILTITRQGIDVFVDGAKITKPNVILENGVAHILDEVPNPTGSAPPPVVTGAGVQLVSHQTGAAVAAGFAFGAAALNLFGAV